MRNIALGGGAETDTRAETFRKQLNEKAPSDIGAADSDGGASRGSTPSYFQSCSNRACTLTRAEAIALTVIDSHSEESLRLGRKPAECKREKRLSEEKDRKTATDGERVKNKNL
ncbi:hypothetical protein NDU88_008206 [Pleurodeles waltl]|uniref:Uncharacterized protein n=1 Tax=Pleurodeles waltl TaxID=8319 RepID=A0AAV7PNU5_PLEWA|nr:hypothetical protein NDU88_008206 [Pleurodeles waltl]